MKQKTFDITYHKHKNQVSTVETVTSYEKPLYATCALLKFIQNMFVRGATFSMKAFKTMFSKETATCYYHC